MNQPCFSPGSELEIPASPEYNMVEEVPSALHPHHTCCFLAEAAAILDLAREPLPSDQELDPGAMVDEQMQKRLKVLIACGDSIRRSGGIRQRART